LPFVPKDKKVKTMIHQIKSCEPRPIRRQISQQLLNLITLMLQKDPLLRPTPTDIVSLDFIKPYIGSHNTQKRQAILIGEKI
jgi:serine/threonine protein kinase